MRTPDGPRSGRVCGRIALAGCVAIASSMSAQAQVLPSGGVVAAGSASILAIDSANTVIVQQSSKAVVNWQSFSVGAGANVTFRQPDAAAITLNRVTGTSASIINGNLIANGQVWLVNGNGILMGQGSRIDVGGLIATTSDIADQDFLSGRYDFGRAPGDGAVINRGSIKAATGGSAILSGAHVANEGLIQAKLGRVVLGGAKAFSVSFDGDNLIQYQITAPVSESPKDGDGKPVSALVSNSGTIDAEGGQVLMTAHAARNVVDNVINSTGIIQARSASVRNGEVVLDAGEGGAVAIGGTVDVSGGQAGESGGALTVLGEKIAVAGGARLDASGNSGGGQILIGGNLQAAGPLPNAQSVTVGKAAITADATNSGKGGTVAIVSSGQTSVAATISARGVAAGGMVETSGHSLSIAESARVDTSAVSGVTGLWLLDPIDIDIDSAAASNIVASIASTNVSVTASNDITVNAPIAYASANSLTFLAGHNLTVNAEVQNSGSGDILAVAGWDGVTVASRILTTPGAYGNGGGSVLISGNNKTSDNASLGSRNGATRVAAWDLTIAADVGYAQLGYHGAPSSTIFAQGPIDVVLNGQLTMVGSDIASSSFAQIGHGGRLVNGNLSGAITISAQKAVNVAGGASVEAYALIGHGGFNSGGTTSGGVRLTSGGDIALGSGGSISSGGTGDTIVLAAAGDFSNQSGIAAFGISPGGRWLVFLNSPANNIPGGLSGLPFYNRAFDFSTNSFAPVASAGNRFVYAIAPVVTVTANNSTKVYGAVNPVFSAAISGGLAGDSSVGVFTGSPLLATSATTGSAAGNYAISASLGTLTSDYNYGFQFVTGVLQVNPALLSASLTGTVHKTYDGTTAANLSASNYNLIGLVGGDSVSVSSAITAYGNGNVGTGKIVTASGLTLSGSAAGNYVLTTPVISAPIGIIDPAILSAALTGTVHKTYDGTTAAILSAFNYVLAGVIPGDSVALNNPSAGSYGDKNAGAGKTVTVSGLALSGPASGNYVLAAPAISAAIGVIDPAVLIGSLTGTVRKTYDGTVGASLSASNYALAGTVPGDSVTLNPATVAYGDKNAGTGKIVAASGLTLSGVDAGNYILGSPGLSAAIGIIDPAVLTASLVGTVQKPFDGTSAATLDASNYNLSAPVSGDDVRLNNPIAGSFNSATGGIGKTVTVTGLTLLGTGSGNYFLASSTISGGVGVIAVAPIDVLGNSFTSNGVTIFFGQSPPLATANAPAQGPSDATSDTGGAQPDSAAFSLGQSLSGNAQPSSAVLLDGLLRQVTPAAGGQNRGVPPYGQIFSSWGNEAFWQ